MNPTRRVLIARDHDPSRLLRSLTGGEVERIRRGAYRTAPGRTENRGPAAQRELARDQIRAVHHQLGARHVFSHVSAALLRGAPLWRPPRSVHVLVPSRPSARSAADIVRRTGIPDRADLVAGLPVTDRVRTVVDCAVTMPPLDALVIADWALAQGMPRSAAAELLSRSRRRNGIARARWVLEYADSGAESPWESWVRYLALRAGLPRPRTQLPVTARGKRYRVDVAWPEHRVLVEFDGAVKYVDGAFGEGYDADRARFEEKLRDDAIAAEWGVRPLHFTARDAAAPLRVTARLLTEFPRSVRESVRVVPLLPLPDEE